MIAAIVSLSAALGVIAPAAMAAELHDTIDQQIAKRAGGPVAGLAGDAEFLRRISIDLTGKLPTPTAAKKFFADPDAAKRTKLIDRLLASEDFPRRMQEAFTSMLLERRSDAKIPDAQWEEYLRDSFAANKPWDQLVSELLFVDEEDEAIKPASKFFLVSGRNDANLKTEDVARLFLGRDIACSQCHDHPTVNDYTQSEYFGLFTYLKDKPAEATIEFESVFISGKHTTGPRLPGGEELKIPTFEKDQQQEAAKYRPRMLLSRDLPTAGNEPFVRNSVNRLWFLMMGRGLVHPLDQHHYDNPPSHPELLDALSAAFVAHKFDIKWLLREIALSQSYQRSSQLPEGVALKDAPPQLYRVAVLKPLTPEQMCWCVLGASGNLDRVLNTPAPEKSEFSHFSYINGLIDQFPENVPEVMKLFVGVYGNPPGEPEVDFTPAMGHALFLKNDQGVLEWLKPQAGNLVERLAKMKDAATIADELYVSVLTRMPSEEETAEVAAYLAQFKDRRSEALGELAWALLASAEFRMNH
ncbi:hypothetical protein Pla52o_06630 [Novipirellula galeiformis]|uniref:Cytochrome c domain-containing protein n=1 Tax=Novipirellula galeiformis TaxID=2528004 RepID=A0A5C6CR29_9BACT|nr:DUF1549 domain-containing protein [Novipirellula galeiformis]TWU26808.1 hypothetical protein Pla52o_06630 [Novipirellula galeiformis]